MDSAARSGSGIPPSPAPAVVIARRLRRYLGLHRLAVQASIDSLAWAVALFLGVAVRFDLEFDASRWGPFDGKDLLTASVSAVVVQLGLGWALGLYQGRWRFGSFEEVAALVQVVLPSTALLVLANRLLPNGQLMPNSAVLIAGVLALVIMAAARYLWRLQMERSLRPSEQATRVLVFGAGEGGVQLITATLRNPESQFLPVALLDDDPSLANLRILGVPVLGDRNSISEVAEATSAKVLIIAIPSADASLVRQITGLGEAAGLEVRVLPPVQALLDGTVTTVDVRPVTEDDLLGRHIIDTDVDSIAGYLTGRRILVTGAGGSIGSELCRQVARFAPAELVMLDRDESALHGVQLSIDGRALLDSRNLVVADVRDLARLEEVFEEHAPQVVFHAAALKHLPLLQLHPREAVKTNVFGTLNLLEVSRRAGVERFVNISTDKAADPTSILGFTKRIAERLTTGVAEVADGTYLSVRFGNVLGSRGSVLTAFRSQVADGGPLTVTHPEVTRYFMTVEEAVQLVIQAGAVGRDGEALVLDMGSPVRIAEVAERLAAGADRKVSIVYTGLRPGEKLHEVLLGEGEEDQRPFHPLISQVSVPSLIAKQLEPLQGTQESDGALSAALMTVCELPAIVNQDVSRILD